MQNIKLTLAYDGTDFCGWQVQKQGERTVQGELEQVLFQIVKEKVSVIGAGRTDSGVHAHGQVVHFQSKAHMTAEQFQKAINALLPDDVVVLQAEEVSADFHAQHSAVGKVYRYSLLSQPYIDPVKRRFVWWYPYNLDVCLMQTEAKELLGQHDFCSFTAVEALNRVSSTIRKIKRLDIEKSGVDVTVTIEGDGFLYKMVRNIVGTLVEVGSGQRPIGSVADILQAKKRVAAGVTAPPQGLFLEQVYYK